MLVGLIQDLPVSAATPEPMPNPLTAVFYHDTNRDGIMGDNESMATGVTLEWQENHVDGTALGATAQSDSTGRFFATMQPCPCTWVLRANGYDLRGSTNAPGENTYVEVGIKRYDINLPVVMSCDDQVTGDVVQ